MNLELLTKKDLDELVSKINNLIEVVANKGIENHANYYTNDELSKTLVVSKRTLQNYRDKGMIEFTQIGRKIFYPVCGVQKFMDERRVSFNS
jgi:hypothetical protein